MQVYHGKSCNGPQGVVLVLGGFTRPLPRAGRWCSRGPWFAVQGAQVRILRALFPAQPGRPLCVTRPAARAPTSAPSSPLFLDVLQESSPENPHQLQGWSQTRGCFPKSWIPHGVCSEELSCVSMVNLASSNLGETVATTVGLGVGFLRTPCSEGPGLRSPSQLPLPKLAPGIRPAGAALELASSVWLPPSGGKHGGPRSLATALGHGSHPAHSVRPASQSRAASALLCVSASRLSPRDTKRRTH